MSQNSCLIWNHQTTGKALWAAFHSWCTLHSHSRHENNRERVDNWTEALVATNWILRVCNQNSRNFLCSSEEAKESSFVVLEGIMCPMVFETRKIFNSTFMAFGNSCGIQNVGPDVPRVCGNQIKVVSSYRLPKRAWYFHKVFSFQMNLGIICL